ncbi:SnoaL-like domain-containing protein [Ekhidna sp.]|uniref:SnoaL-like domain-containing protein n=1 Tax=Ekhidna sp. TaxID=2608089 RepID=UPI003298605B
MSLLEKEQELHQMIGEGKMMEAFEKFYADNVVMVEPMLGTTEGKDANRAREQQWLEMVQEVHGGGVTAITSNEEDGLTMSESWMEASYKDGNRAKMEEVSVKKWENGQVVHERFYYTMPG